MALWLLVLAAAPVVLAFVVLCLREPLRVALPIFAAVIPFGGALSIGASPFGSASSLMGLLLGAGLALQFTTNRRAAPTLPSTAAVWLLFLGAAGATVLWTINLSVTVTGLAVLGSLALTYVLVAISDVDRTVVRRTENGLLLGGVVVVCYGLYQLFVLGGFPDDVPGVGTVPDGRFGNDLLGPNIQAVSLMLPFVLALDRAFAAVTFRWGLRLLHAGFAVLMLWGVLMTGSRTGTLAAALVVLTLACTGQRRARKGLFAFLAAGVAVSAWVWVYQPAGVASRSFESATSSSGRLEIWSVGLASCSDYCVFGSGWGTFSQVYAETQASVPGAKVLVSDEGAYQAHNLWILVVVELGIPGLVLLTCGMLLGLWEAWRIPRALRGPPLSALVGLIFGVFFLSSMEFKFFWMVFIMIALYANLSRSLYRGSQRQRTGSLATGRIDPLG